jgi:hypothetical protein
MPTTADGRSPWRHTRRPLCHLSRLHEWRMAWRVWTQDAPGVHATPHRMAPTGRLLSPLQRRTGRRHPSQPLHTRNLGAMRHLRHALPTRTLEHNLRLPGTRHSTSHNYPTGWTRLHGSRHTPSTHPAPKSPADARPWQPQPATTDSGPALPQHPHPRAHTEQRGNAVAPGSPRVARPGLPGAVLSLPP